MLRPPGDRLALPARAALARARVNWFVDTWDTKVGSFMFSIFRAGTEEEKQQKADEFVATIKKEIEPFLADAGPFFGGSKKLTLAEVWSILHDQEDEEHMLKADSNSGPYRPVPSSHLRLFRRRRAAYTA